MKSIQQALAKYWGYHDFLPLQKEAMSCLHRRSVTASSYCRPAGASRCATRPRHMAADGLAVVVSPLIALMKDQVDALIECGVPAMRLDSSMTVRGAKGYLRIAAARRCQAAVPVAGATADRRIHHISAETQESPILPSTRPTASVCGGMTSGRSTANWGSCGIIFGDVTIAAYTATATAQVREDIAVQLRLKKPEMLVGSFDRPNLCYKVQPRKNIHTQVCGVLERHKGESGVIYCIRRRDVDELCIELKNRGYNVAGYHAGMSPEQRKGTARTASSRNRWM